VPLFRKKPISQPVARQVTAAAPSVPVTTFRGDPQGPAVKRLLAQGRWQEFHSFLERITDWDRREWYLGCGVSGIAGLPQWLDEWAAARPDSGLPLLVKGVRGANWAWEARGSGRAKSVGADAWPVFYERLVAADQALSRAAALDARDPLPVAHSITVAMGLQLGQDEARRRFGEAHRRDRLNGTACAAMVQATARKWGGTNEGMLQWARWVSSEASDGAQVHKWVAYAHIECWLDAEKGPAQQRYFLRPEVKQEVLASAQRCVLSPSYAMRDLTIRSCADRNIYAFCFSLMHEYGAALDMMRLIGPYVTPSPWSYQGKAGEKYEFHRQRAFRELSGTPAPAWADFLAAAGHSPLAEASQ
jgi:hypothetical protein